MLIHNHRASQYFTRLVGYATDHGLVKVAFRVGSTLNVFKELT